MMRALLSAIIAIAFLAGCDPHPYKYSGSSVWITHCSKGCNRQHFYDKYGHY